MKTTKRRRPVALAVIGAILSLAAQAAEAQNNDSQISQLINQGKIAEARALLEASDPSDVDRLFFEGRLLKAYGRLDEAIDLFRETLRRDPEHLNAEFELALSLLDAERYDGAEFHLEKLLKIDPREEMRDLYERFLAVIDRHEPVGFNVQFALLPSTNVNRGSSKTIIDTDFGPAVIETASRRNSGLGFMLGADGYLRKRISAADRLSFLWGANGQKYANRDYDSLSLSFAAEHERRNETSRRRLGPYGRIHLHGGDNDHVAVGLRASFDYAISPFNALAVAASHERISYAHRDDLDGFSGDLSLSLRHQYAPDLALWGGVGIGFFRPQAEYQGYDDARAFVGVEKSWRGGLHTQLSPTVGRREYLGDFPLVGVARDDVYYRLSGSVYNSRFNFQGLTPKLFCSYTLNVSNINLYDYDVYECVTALTSKF